MFGQALMKNIIGLPSTVVTIGWPSWPRSAPVDCDQIICRCFTFFVLIWVSLLLRSRARFCPIDGQSAGLALFCASSASEPACAKAVPHARAAAKKIAAGASTVRQLGDFIRPPWVRRTGTDSSYLLRFLVFRKYGRSLPALLHECARERRPPGRDMVLRRMSGTVALSGV